MVEGQGALDLSAAGAEDATDAADRVDIGSGDEALEDLMDE